MNIMKAANWSVKTWLFQNKKAQEVVDNFVRIE
jgi:hypothetical protein